MTARTCTFFSLIVLTRTVGEHPHSVEKRILNPSSCILMSR